MLMNGTVVAEYRLKILKEKIEKLKSQGKRKPKLAVILVGDDPASQTYVRAKEKKCASVNMESETFRFDASISEIELIKSIEDLNKDNTVDGILVQLPLPSTINEQHIINTIDPNKDVDGLHTTNIGKLVTGEQGFVPCTPKGIMSLLDYYNVSLAGKNALVIGRSRLVGNPVATLLQQSNATVTQAHSHTQNLEELILLNEIIVVAMGKKEFIKREMLRSYHVVIDVGIHRHQGALYGDVEKTAYDKVSMITPVPKGVGPMTIVGLLENTLEAYLLHERMTVNEL